MDDRVTEVKEMQRIYARKDSESRSVGKRETINRKVGLSKGWRDEWGNGGVE